MRNLGGSSGGGGGGGVGTTDLVIEKVKLGLVTSQSIPDTSETDITWPSGANQIIPPTSGITWAPSGAHPERLTIVNAGLVEVVASLYLNTPISGRVTCVIKRFNSAGTRQEYVEQDVPATAGQFVEIAAKFDCAAGDYVVMAAFQTSGSSKNATGDASFNNPQTSLTITQVRGAAALTRDYGAQIIKTDGSTQSISNASWTKVLPFDNVVVQNGLTVDATNGKITVPKAGTYVVGFGGGYSLIGVGADKIFYFAIKVNGSFLGFPNATATSDGANDPQASDCLVIALQANDYVELFTYNADTASRTLNLANISMVLAGSPGVGAPIGANVRSSSAQVVVNDAAAVYNQGSATSDYNDGCTVGTSDTSITVPTSGTYDAVAEVAWPAGGNTIGCRGNLLYVNGVQQQAAYYAPHASSHKQVLVPTPHRIKLNAGDKVQVGAYQDSGGSITPDLVALWLQLSK